MSDEELAAIEARLAAFSRFEETMVAVSAQAAVEASVMGRARLPAPPTMPVSLIYVGGKADVLALLAEVKTLRGILSDMAQDGQAERYQAGVEAGKAAEIVRWAQTRSPWQAMRPNRFVWFSHEDLERQPENLPADLFARLKGGELVAGSEGGVARRSYPSMDEAVADLSQAVACRAKGVAV